jgi:putative oxidoreductase
MSCYHDLADNQFSRVSLLAPNRIQEVQMIDPRTAPYAALALRVALGALFLAHAGLKLFVFTPAGTAQFFGKLGLPPALAYLTIAVELVGGLCLILGFLTRWAALGLFMVLIGAIVTVHGANGFFFDNAGGGWEYPAFWAVALLVHVLLGDGACALRSLSGSKPRELAPAR